MSEQAFVISDLHLGGGAAEPDLESFREDAEFAAFIGSLPTAGTTLFINGDFVDFLKVPPYEVPDPDHLLWNERSSVAKIRAAVAAHDVCFDALARFAGEGKLRILVGNHDLDVAWPGVQQVLRQALGNPPADRLRFTVGSEVYHGVHIEHGHAFTAENRPADPESFIHRWPAAGEPSDLYLERVWGADLLLSVINDLEREYPFADKVKPRLTLVYYGLRNGWVKGRHLVRMLLFLKRRKVPLGMVFRGADDREPDFDSVAGSFDEPRWRAAIHDRVAAEPGFRDEVEAAIRDLSPEDRRILAQPVSVDPELPDPNAPVEAEAMAFGLVRDRREVRAARDRLGQSGVTHVVFGHTHDIVDGELDGALYNPGSWVPHLNLRSPAVREKVKRHGVTKEMLQDRSLWAVERRAVHIRPGSAHRAQVGLVKI